LGAWRRCLEFAADVASGYVKGKPPQGQSDAP
jgi:hypothetical protein